MMNTTQPYRLQFPIFRWLFLVFLSAGLANSSFQFESLRPVYCVENVSSIRKNLADNKRTIRFAAPYKTGFKLQTLRLQSIRLAFLAQLTEIRCKISYVLYPVTYQFKSYHTAITRARSILASPDDIPFPV